MPRRKRGRDIDGVVLLDKPEGVSSNAALQRVRRAFDARKAGHTGSLDPLARGLLPVCLGEATKVAGYLLQAQKHYRVTALAGSRTATGDREGAVLAEGGAAVPGRDRLHAILRGFVGPQRQIPPMYSALKHQGKPLYAYARAGQTIERAPRAIEVYALRLIEREAAGFTLDVRVSSGTYIRTLVEDIAQSWDGYAHVGRLRRLGVGRLGEQQQMVTLESLERRAAHPDALAKLLRPVSTVTADWPAIVLDSAQVIAIQHGRQVELADAPCDSADAYRLVDAQGRFYGFGTLAEPRLLAPKRLFARIQH